MIKTPDYLLLLKSGSIKEGNEGRYSLKESSIQEVKNNCSRFRDFIQETSLSGSGLADLSRARVVVGVAFSERITALLVLETFGISSFVGVPELSNLTRNPREVDQCLEGLLKSNTSKILICITARPVTLQGLHHRLEESGMVVEKTTSEKGYLIGTPVAMKLDTL